MERNKMIEGNIGLAKSIAKNWSEHMDRYSYEEYLSTAYEYIVRGCENFDPTRGAKISTYLHKYINGGIKRMITDDKKYNIKRNTPIEVKQISFDGFVNVKDDEILLSEIVGNHDVEYNNSEMNEFIENTMRKYSKGKMIHNIDRNIEIIKLSLFYGLTENDISNKLENEITSQTIGRIIRRFRDWAKEELTK